jgi:hypothetical protein
LTDGTVTIDTHQRTLPEEQARTLFLLATAISKRGGGALAVDPDTLVIVNSSTPITDGFTDQYDPATQLDALTKGRKITIVPFA